MSGINLSHNTLVYGSDDHIKDERSKIEDIESILNEPPPNSETVQSFANSMVVPESNSDGTDIQDFGDQTTSMNDYEKTLPDSLCRPLRTRTLAVENVLVVVNPQSGSQQGKELAEQVKAQLTQKGLHADIFEMSKDGSTVETIRTMDLSRIQVIAVVGGDGTIHQVINGLLERGDNAAQEVGIAIFPAGTGNSLARELNQMGEPSEVIERVCRGVAVPIDIVKTIHTKAHDKSQQVMYAFNSIHWGIAAAVNAEAEKLRWTGSDLRYTTGALLAMMKGESKYARVSMEQENGTKLEYEDDFSLIIVNNISVTGRGMHMFPEAKMNDGLMDVMLVTSDKALDLLQMFVKVYRGTHVELPFVEYRQVKSLKIVPFDHRESHTRLEELVDIDGELKGCTPISCEIMPRAISFIA